MAETKDYVKYRGQLGKTFYRWYIHRLDEDDNVLLASGEEPSDNLGSGSAVAQTRARRAARRALFEHPDADQVTIYRGTYEESIIEDDEYGQVFDVDWVEDERWNEYGYPQGHRWGRAVVEWETDER